MSNDQKVGGWYFELQSHHCCLRVTDYQSFPIVFSELLASSDALSCGVLHTSILRKRCEQQGSDFWLALIRISFLLVVLSLLVRLFVWFHGQVEPGAAALRSPTCSVMKNTF